MAPSPFSQNRTAARPLLLNWGPLSPHALINETPPSAHAQPNRAWHAHTLTLIHTQHTRAPSLPDTLPRAHHGEGAPLPLDCGPRLRMSPEGVAFMKRCLVQDWAQRMTVAEALDHPWWVASCSCGGVEARARAMVRDLVLRSHQTPYPGDSPNSVG